MTDKEKKHLQEIQNVPVDEEKLRNDRKNAISFKQETTYELTLELMDIERKKAESSIDALEVKEVQEPTASDRGMAEEIIINLKRVEQDYHIDLTREMEWLRKKAQKG